MKTNDRLRHGKQRNDPQQNEIVNHQVVVIIQPGIDDPAMWAFSLIGADRFSARLAFHHGDIPFALDDVIKSKIYEYLDKDRNE